MQFRKLLALVAACALGITSSPAQSQTYNASGFPTSSQPVLSTTPIAGTLTPSASCSTPTTLTQCSSSSFAEFDASQGAADVSFQITALNGGSVGFFRSNDGINFTASNATISGGNPSALAVAQTTSTPGTFSLIGGAAHYIAIVVLTAPTSAFVITPNISQKASSVSVHGIVPVTLASGQVLTVVPSPGATFAINCVAGCSSGTAATPGPADANNIPYTHPTGLVTASPAPADSAGIPFTHPTGVATPQVLQTGTNGAQNVNTLNTPSPADSAGIPYTHPTGGPLAVTQSGAFTISCASGGCPTPLANQPVSASTTIPVALPSGYVQPISGAPTPNAVQTVVGTVSVTPPSPAATFLTNCVAGCFSPAPSVTANAGTGFATVGLPGASPAPSANVAYFQGIGAGGTVPISGSITATQSYPYPGATQTPAATTAANVGVDCIYAGSVQNSVTSGNAAPCYIDAGGNHLVATNYLAQTGSLSAVASGGPPSTPAVTYLLTGAGSVGVNVAGTFVGTLNGQFSHDGVTYTQAVPLGVTTSASITTTGNYGFTNFSGAQYFRIIFTAYTSGTATIVIHGGPAFGGPIVGTPGSGLYAAVTTPSTASVGGNTPGVVGVNQNEAYSSIAGGWSQVNKDPFLAGSVQTASGGATYVVDSASGITTAAGVTTAGGVIKATAGRIVRYTVTAAPTTAVAFSCYDNPSAASGNIILTIPTVNQTQGFISPELSLLSSTGIYCLYGPTTGTIVFTYS